MLALGYVTRYSGTDATLGLAMAKTGRLYPFFGTLLGWLGVALTGSDTASNVLFGNLQTITAKSQLSRIDYNVFEGFACLGAPIITLSRGKIAWAEGELRAEKGDGRYIERPPFSPVHVANSTWREQTAPKGVRRSDVTRATIFEDQYISTGGQFYELIVGHDRFNADLRPAFYRLQNQPEGLCCHPYDCATLLIAEEAGVVVTDEKGAPLDGPLDTTTGLSWLGYANPELHKRIEPLLLEFLARKGK